MASPTPIFDTTLMWQRLRRALAQGPADFLLARAAEDLAERLTAVQRSFARVADIGTPGPHLATALRHVLPDAMVVRCGAVIASEAKQPRSRRTQSCSAAEGGAWVASPEPAGGPAEGRARWARKDEPDTLAVEGNAEALPLAPERLDLAVSALALQTVNDLPGALIQIRRALKPDGLFLAALLGGRTLHELRTVLAEAESEFYGGVSPRVAPFADVRDLGGLLQRAGFALPVADSDTLSVRYATLFDLMRDLRAMGATNALVARRLRPTRRGLFLRAAALYAERFADPDGRIRATFEIVSLSGWAAHASQQVPAQRGSGRASLAAALDDRTQALLTKD